MEIDDYENGAKFLEMGNNRDASFYELAGDFYKYFGENELANENYDLAISADTDETQKNLINLKDLDNENTLKLFSIIFLTGCQTLGLINEAKSTNGSEW